MGRRAQETDNTFRGGTAGEFAGSSSTGDLRRLEEGTFLHRGLFKKHGGPFTGNYER